MSDDSRPAAERGPDSDRLESWKEIAAYLRRGVRTVRRWEKEEELPVHRQLHRTLGSVYAHRSEIDAWRQTRRRRSGDSVPVPRPSRSRTLLAVLPFHNISGDPGQEHIADGLTEEMIAHLARYDAATLGVIARTTVMHYKEKSRTIRQIAAELHVDYLIEGSVRREADRIRVVAHLIRARDESHLWSRTYEQSMPSILMLQRDLAADVARGVRLTLSPSLPFAGQTPIVNPDAYETYLRGRQDLNAFTPESVRRSVDRFQQAIEADPAYAAAHASLAEAYAWLPIWLETPSREALPLALAAAERALQLAPDLPDAHLALGLVHAYYQWSWPTAEHHFSRAIELHPAHPTARQWYAEYLAELGRATEALEVLEPCRADDPLSQGVPASRAFVLWLDRRFDEAIAESRRMLARDPAHAMALIRLGVSYEALGRYALAAKVLRKAERTAPGLLACISLQALAHGRAGNRRQALRCLDRLQQLSRERYVPAFLFANVHLGLGDVERAIALIEEEYESRGWYLLLLKRAPFLDSLRAHPRFQTLVRRMNFPE